jgi:hypothetical protein
MNVAIETTKVTRVGNAVVAGTTAQYSSAVDMTGYEEVLFVAAFGTVTDGTPTVKVQVAVDAAFTSPIDVKGSSVSVTPTTHNNKVAVVTVKRPSKTFVRLAVMRSGSTGQVIDGILAFQFRGKGVETQSTSVLATKTLVAPEEGTA